MPSRDTVLVVWFATVQAVTYTYGGVWFLVVPWVAASRVYMRMALLGDTLAATLIAGLVTWVIYEAWVKIEDDFNEFCSELHAAFSAQPLLWYIAGQAILIMLELLWERVMRWFKDYVIENPVQAASFVKVLSR